MDAARSVYERACSIHLQKKPTIHIEWAAFEEAQGSISKAVAVLTELQKSFPDLLLISTRLIGLYRRRQDKDKGEEILRRVLWTRRQMKRSETNDNDEGKGCGAIG